MFSILRTGICNGCRAANVATAVRAGGHRKLDQALETGVGGARPSAFQPGFGDLPVAVRDR